MKRQTRTILEMAAIIPAVFAFAVIWEFFLEDGGASLALFSDHVENADLKWEFVFTSTFFAAIALIVPALLVLKSGKHRSVMENRLHEALANSEKASRAKSDFLSGMSHELRTPLNAIIGFSSILESETLGPLGEKPKEYAGDIRRSGEHLLELINDILDATAVEAGAIGLDEGQVNVGDVIDEGISMLRIRAAEGKVHLIRQVEGALPLLFADKRRLKQVLINLLTNAIKFTPAGGKVSLMASLDGQGAYVFKVTDTGIGLDEEEKAVALTKFGQVKGDLVTAHEGTGLGLPLSQALIEQHGGTLTIDSEKTVGTTVTVRFPAERTVIS